MGWRAVTLKNTVQQKKFKTHYMNNSYIVSLVKMQSVSKNNHLDHLEMTVRSGLEFWVFLKSFHAVIFTLGTSYKESFFPKITNSVTKKGKFG